MGRGDRKHHARVETADDPPVRILGITACWGAACCFTSRRRRTRLRRGKRRQGTPDDWLRAPVYSKYVLFRIDADGVADVLLSASFPARCLHHQIAWNPSGPPA